MGEYENEIKNKYRIIIRSEWKKIKKGLIRDMGFLPILFYMMFSTIILSVVSAYYLIKNIDFDIIRLQFGENTILIWSFICGIIIFLIYLFIGYVCIILFAKSVELNVEVKK